MNNKILILEDHNIVAAGLFNLIKQEFDGFEAAIAITFPDGLDLLKELQPVELVILDVQLPGSESVKMVSLLRAVQPGVRILVFTALEDTRHALNFLSAGANGFISKKLELPHVAHAIRTVLDNKKYMTEEVQQKVAESFFQNLNPSTVYEDISLTPRENEVLELMLEGKKTKDISHDLKLKLTTVSSHKSRIFEKLRVNNIVELVKKYKTD
jgi:two-component system invasion response regulator UvrY